MHAALTHMVPMMPAFDQAIGSWIHVVMEHRRATFALSTLSSAKIPELSISYEEQHLFHTDIYGSLAWGISSAILIAHHQCHDNKPFEDKARSTCYWGGHNHNTQESRLCTEYRGRRIIDESSTVCEGAVCGHDAAVKFGTAFTRAGGPSAGHRLSESSKKSV